MFNIYDAVRTLLNYFNTIPNSRQTQIDVLTDNIEWSKREKRIFLKHSLEIPCKALPLSDPGNNADRYAGNLRHYSTSLP